MTRHLLKLFFRGPQVRFRSVDINIQLARSGVASGLVPVREKDSPAVWSLTVCHRQQVVPVHGVVVAWCEDRRGPWQWPAHGSSSTRHVQAQPV